MYFPKKINTGLSILQHVENKKEVGGKFTTFELLMDIGISQSYCESILKILITKGLIKSVRGRNGGYYLTREDYDIQKDNFPMMPLYRKLTISEFYHIFYSEIRISPIRSPVLSDSFKEIMIDEII